MYFVYRYMNGEDLVYIGITNNLKTRKSQHSVNSKWYNDGLKYEFIKVDNKYIAKNFEEYLINRDRPTNNKAENNKYDVSQITFNIKEDWKPYTEKTKEPNRKNNTLASKKKKESSDENNKKAMDIYHDIFYNNLNEIIDICYNEYEKLTITFNSKRVRKLIEDLICLHYMVPYVDSVEYGYNDDIVKISLNDRNTLTNYIYPEFVKIYDILKIESLNLDKQYGKNQKKILKEHKEKLLNDMINNNAEIQLIRIKNGECITIPVNDVFLIAEGIKSIYHYGSVIELLFNNNKRTHIYLPNLADIKDWSNKNKFKHNEFCFKTQQDKDLFFYKMTTSKINFTICTL